MLGGWLLSERARKTRPNTVAVGRSPALPRAAQREQLLAPVRPASQRPQNAQGGETRLSSRSVVSVSSLTSTIRALWDREDKFAVDSLLERRRFELAVPPRSRARLAGRAGRFPAGRARPTLAMDVECAPHLSLSRTVGRLADQHPNCQLGLTRYRRTGTG